MRGRHPYLTSESDKSIHCVAWMCPYHAFNRAGRRRNLACGSAVRRLACIVGGTPRPTAGTRQAVVNRATSRQVRLAGNLQRHPESGEMMKRLLHWTGMALGSLAALAIIAYGAVYSLSERILRRTYEVPAVAISIPTDPASIIEGRRLAIRSWVFQRLPWETGRRSRHV